MENFHEKPFLLTQARNLLVRGDGLDFVIEQLPEWLAESQGKTPTSFLGKSVEKEMEKIVPGLTELLKRTVESDSHVKGFRTGLIDIHGDSHQLLLDTEIRHSSTNTYFVSVIIQEIPLESSSEKAVSASIFCNLVGKSDLMQNVFNKIRMYAGSSAPVLITGETGAGKEGVAEAIHKLSKRSSKPFVTMNCSAITETLFESELFGHEKGSFTGAIKTHRGRFERADGGTLFLDEIGDLPLSSQAKLLRVLETGKIEKVGSEKTVDINVRIVAATNHDLERNSMAKTFRSDLFYRINALQVKIPPLRKRVADIEPLIQHFIYILNKKYDRNVSCLTKEAIQLLKQYQWPGNVRELRNLMERLFAENRTEVIGLRSLKEWYEERQAVFRHDENKEDGYHEVTVLPYKKAIPLGMDEDNPERILPADFSRASSNGSAGDSFQGKDISKNDLIQAYRKSSGNITKASEILGIHKATFYRQLKNFNLTREDLENKSGT